MTASEEYFNQIYSGTYRLLSGYIARRLGSFGYHDICDTLQETYTEFYRAVSRKGSRPPDNPQGLLYTIADRRISRKYRQKAKRTRAEIPLYLPADDGELCIADLECSEVEYTEEDGTLDRLMADEIMAVVRADGEPDASIFLLRYERDMKLEDIASALGLEIHTVRNRLYRKLKVLREYFGGDQDE